MRIIMIVVLIINALMILSSFIYDYEMDDNVVEIPFDGDLRMALMNATQEKPLNDGGGYYCPVCHNRVYHDNDGVDKFCPNCGKMIDWRGYEQ